MGEWWKPPRYTRYDRIKALYRLVYELQRSPSARLGLSSDRIIMIDIDCTGRPVCRILWHYLAKWLCETYEADVAVLRTDRGYHIVVLREVRSRMDVIQRELKRLGELGEKLREYRDVERAYTDLLEFNRRMMEEARRSGNVRAYREYRIKVADIERRLRLVRRNIKHLTAAIEQEKRRAQRKLREASLTEKFFEDVYYWILRVKRGRIKPSPSLAFWCMKYCCDEMHAFITLQRKYTTLRISGKPGKPYDIWLRRIYKYSSEGISIVDFKRS